MKPKPWGARGAFGTFAVLCCLPGCAGHNSEPAAGAAAGAAGVTNVGGSNGSGGNSSAAHGGAGGGSGSGGAPEQPPAQAGLTATIQQPAAHVDSMSCPVIHTYHLGAPEAPTATDPGTSIVSGDAGSRITCSVSSAASGSFVFSGTLHATTDEGDLVSISFANGSITGDSGIADVSIFTPQLSANFASQTPCTVQVLNGQVKAGAIWATFDCPQITSPPSGLCELQGTLVLENCSGS